MRLLLISRCPPYPLHLGDRLILFHLARELSQRGHRLDLLAFDDRPDIADDRAAYAAYFGHVELFPASRRSPLSLLQRLLPGRQFPRRADESWSPQMWAAIEARMREHAYDAALLFGGIQVYEFREALRGLPAIITPYESYSLYLRRALERAGGMARLALIPQLVLARAFERFMFSPYARTVVVADRDADELHMLKPALNVSVIPNGVDLPAPANAPREAATLLFTGNFEYAPNVDAALALATDILPRVWAEFPDVRLLLVGNAPPPELQVLANERVIVTGRVPALLPYLQSATLFVCPLRLGAGIKNKVLEALAAGCPVVVTPLSVDGIDAENGRDLLIADMEALPAAVIDLLRDPDLQRKLSEHGRRLVAERYSWARVAEMYESLFEAARHSRAL